MDALNFKRLNLPEISGNAGIRDLVEAMREPSYLKLLGKCLGGGMGAGLLARRLPPQLALPVALMAGIYIGLEMAAWMEEEAAKSRGPMIDVTPAAPVEEITVEAES
jgi:hypothetical protein